MRRVWRPAVEAPPDHPDIDDIRALLARTRDMFLDQNPGRLADVFVPGAVIVGVLGGQAVVGPANCVFDLFDKPENRRILEPRSVRDWALTELVLGEKMAQAVIEASDADARYFALAALCCVDPGWRVASVMFEIV